MMKKWMAALLAVLMLTGVAALAAADNDVQITATGSAQVTAVPDMFCVTANASAQAETVGKAQEQIGAIVEQMKQALQAVGVAEDQIVTTGYGYYPAYDYSSYDENGVNKIIGYQANHTMRITCADRYGYCGYCYEIGRCGACKNTPPRQRNKSFKRGYYNIYR